MAATSASDLVQVVASGGGTLLAVAGLVLVAAATQRRLAARREAATPRLAPFPMALRALPGGWAGTKRRRRQPRLTLVVGTPPRGEGAPSRAPAGSPPTAS